MRACLQALIKCYTDQSAWTTHSPIQLQSFDTKSNIVQQLLNSTSFIQHPPQKSGTETSFYNHAAMHISSKWSGSKVYLFCNSTALELGAGVFQHCLINDLQGLASGHGLNSHFCCSLQVVQIVKCLSYGLCGYDDTMVGMQVDLAAVHELCDSVSCMCMAVSATFHNYSVCCMRWNACD